MATHSSVIAGKKHAEDDLVHLFRSFAKTHKFVVNQGYLHYSVFSVLSLYQVYHCCPCKKAKYPINQQKYQQNMTEHCAYNYITEHTNLIEMRGH